jgi:hypothetical protein
MLKGIRNKYGQENQKKSQLNLINVDLLKIVTEKRNIINNTNDHVNTYVER